MTTILAKSQALAPSRDIQPGTHCGWLLEHAEHAGPGVLVIGVNQAQAAAIAALVLPPGRQRVIAMPTLGEYDARWQYERRMNATTGTNR